jgi:cellulose synthase/poly-beta-1,6-N-acetylglucosamine synthase-like glycosyltransferase
MHDIASPLIAVLHPSSASPDSIPWQQIWNQIVGDLGVAVDTISGFFSAVHPFIPMAIAGTIVWSIWFARFVMSHTVRPITTDFRTTTSVVVPSYHEDPDILLDCLETWRAQDPDEIIIVLDVRDLEAYDRIVALGDRRVHPLLYEHVGKRSALGVGIRHATGQIVALVDSDTRWLDGLLEAVQMPFADPRVGAVSTQQNVYQRESSVWRRIADWMVDLRYYDYVPAQGKAGAVACVSGRTAVYRRSAIIPVLPRLENEFFLGKRCIAGDDGRLTWLVLASGYRTVHQSSAKAVSMFPTTFRAFVKQRVRWSRNSYRCYLTALAKGWLFRQPIITQLSVLQILLTPVTMGMSISYLVFSRLELTPTGIALAAGWVLFGRGIRGISHLRRHPEDLILLPVMALTVILIALPIKVFAFVTMNKQGWLTRHADQIGGDGQDASSLSSAPITGAVPA